ncbi:MAG: hypothetical protein BWY76_00126 [bacterium ADurb.Bin429]|nr:MAG: hypothetical protein BWY76_00126 [bacterium ADurb.Bin429]
MQPQQFRVAGDGPVDAARFHAFALGVVLALLPLDVLHLVGQQHAVGVPAHAVRILAENIHDAVAVDDVVVRVGHAGHAVGVRGVNVSLHLRGGELFQRLSAPPAILARRRGEQRQVARRPEHELENGEIRPPVAERDAQIRRGIRLRDAYAAVLPDLQRAVGAVEILGHLRTQRRLRLIAGGVQARGHFVTVFRLRRQRDGEVLYISHLQALLGGGHRYSHIIVIQRAGLRQAALYRHNQADGLRRLGVVAERDEDFSGLIQPVEQFVRPHAGDLYRRRGDFRDGKALDAQARPAAAEVDAVLHPLHPDAEVAADIYVFAHLAKIVGDKGGGIAEGSGGAVRVPAGHLDARADRRRRGHLCPQREAEKPRLQHAEIAVLLQVQRSLHQEGAQGVGGVIFHQFPLLCAQQLRQPPGGEDHFPRLLRQPERRHEQHAHQHQRNSHGEHLTASLTEQRFNGNTWKDDAVEGTGSPVSR